MPFLFLSSFFLLTSSFALFFFTFPFPSLSFLLPFLFLYSVFPFFFLFLFSSLPLFLFSSFPFPFPFPLPFLFLSSHTCSSPLPFLFLLEMCPSPSIFINTKPCVGGRVPAKTHLSSPKTRRRQRVLMTTYQVVSGQSYIFAQVMYYMWVCNTLFKRMNRAYVTGNDLQYFNLGSTKWTWRNSQKNDW